MHEKHRSHTYHIPRNFDKLALFYAWALFVSRGSEKVSFIQEPKKGSPLCAAVTAASIIYYERQSTN